MVQSNSHGIYSPFFISVLFDKAGKSFLLRVKSLRDFQQAHLYIDLICGLRLPGLFKEI